MNFIEVSGVDCNCLFEADGCLTWSDRAKYRVREMLPGELGVGKAAKASFPHQPQAEIVVRKTAVLPSQNDFIRLLTHELGHTLGFRHEQVRFNPPEDSTTLGDTSGNDILGCQESSNWRRVTDPDSSSVMGYGVCPGIDGFINSPNDISPLDRAGASYLYNLPRNEVPSYTTPDIDDLLWFLPAEAKYVLWRAALDPEGAISFSEVTEFCAKEGDPASGCSGDFRLGRPVPVANTHERLADVVSFGPGIDSDDSLLLHTPNGPLQVAPANVGGSSQPFDLPIVGRFEGADAAEEVWWVRPGPETDPLGTFDGVYSVAGGGNFGSGSSRDGFFRPIVGHWAELGSNMPNSQVIWYREGSLDFRLSFQSADFLTMSHKVVSPACSVGLAPLKYFPTKNRPLSYPTPLRGDFDGDNQLEVFWASLGNGENVFWRDTFAMWDPQNANVCDNPNIVSIIRFEQGGGIYRGDTLAKPFVGDFDGDDSDDIFWYRSSDGGSDIVWLDIGALSGPRRLAPIVDGVSQSVNGDFSPVVGDYNGDGCDDILWFAPHQSWQVHDEIESVEEGAGESLLWQCIKGTPSPSFSSSSVTPPRGAYPVGYDPRSSVRRADL